MSPSLEHLTLTICSFGTEIAIVKVGDDQPEQEFPVHKALLVRHSEYFAAALGKGWKEGKGRYVTLDCGVTEQFKAFCNFLYTGKIYTMLDENMAGELSSGQSCEWKALCDLWIFGEERLSTSFKDAVVDAMIAKVISNEGVPNCYAPTIYQYSAETSSVRRLLVHIGVWDISAGNLASTERPSHPAAVEYLYDLAVALDQLKDTGRKGRGPYATSDTCAYHEHVAEGKPCYTTMFPS